ncbi:MAG: hypothetical protein ACK481_02490 [Candidatus Melainabacteria bacterium]|jgi:hypothetical protein
MEWNWGWVTKRLELITPTKVIIFILTLKANWSIEYDSLSEVYQKTPSVKILKMVNKKRLLL